MVILKKGAFEPCGSHYIQGDKLQIVMVSGRAKRGLCIWAEGTLHMSLINLGLPDNCLRWICCRRKFKPDCLRDSTTLSVLRKVLLQKECALTRPSAACSPTQRGANFGARLEQHRFEDGMIKIDLSQQPRSNQSVFTWGRDGLSMLGWGRHR